MIFRELILIFIIIFLSVNSSLSSECKKLSIKVKQASEFILGIEFPWWYNVGQLEVESNCLWITSLDGHGSIGYAQITPKFWDKILSKLFPNWQKKDSVDYFLAQAYIVKDCVNNAFCKSKLWNAYQCYNRSCFKVNREAQESNCNFVLAFQICNEKYQELICVWKVNNECRQYRTNCDINYNYSKKVYLKGRKYNPGIIEKKYSFF